jgi:WhiB family transcriptional regulator, redox-sensing transcriptional regulator
MTPLQALITRICTQQPWMADAACHGANPDLFFPNPGQNATQALAICATCTVQKECREAGELEQFGIWGGVTPRQRRQQRADDHGKVSSYNKGCRCEPCIHAKQAVNGARNRKKVA